MLNKEKIVLYYSPLDDNFYVGEKSKGKAGLVNDKVAVTNEFLKCVIHWLENQKVIIRSDRGRAFEITCKRLKNSEEAEI